MLPGDRTDHSDQFTTKEDSKPGCGHLPGGLHQYRKVAPACSHGRHRTGVPCALVSALVPALVTALATWLPLFLLLLLPDSAHGLPCENVPPVPGYACDCESRFVSYGIRGWHLVCYDKHAIMPQQAFTIEYDKNPPSIRVQCDTAAPYQPALFSNFGIKEVERFSFSYCPMPNGSFAPVLEGLKVTSLQLVGCQLGDTLDAQLFSGLNEIEMLTVSWSKELKFVPEDTFVNLATLLRLEINNNGIESLPEKVFWPLKNTLIIKLGGNALQSLHSSQFQGLDKLFSIYLYKNNLTDLPHGLFANLKSLENLNLLSNSLTNVTERDFLELTAIKNLKQGGNPSTTLSDTHFNNNRQLGDLNLSVLNKMTPPPEWLLMGLSRLENIRLQGYNFTSVPEKFFTYAVNMKDIRMVNNRLASLPANLFRENTKLIYLDMSFNDLTELPLTVFEKQFVLETLIFYGNKFVTLKAGPFDNLISLKVLRFEHNFIESIEQDTFKRLQKLEHLMLGKNKLVTLQGNAPFGFNKKLKHVDLSRNNIIEFPDVKWKIYPKLRKLNLDYNNISCLRVPILISPSTDICLRFNNIKAVQVPDREILKKYEINYQDYNFDPSSKHYYHLDGNPFDCNCQLYDFVRYLSDNNYKDIVLFKNSASYTCTGPKTLNGTRLLDVKPDQLTCPIEENCADGCTCFFRMDNSTHMDCRQGNLTSIPTVSPPNTNVLHLQNNQIASIADLGSPQWDNLTKVYLDGNVLKTIDAKRFPRRLQYLSLTNNSLRYLTPELMTMFANSSATLRLAMSGNPWTCDCSTFQFKVWLRRHVYMIEDYLDIACGEKMQFNDTLQLSYIYDIHDSVYCPTDYSAQKRQLAAVSVTCVVLAVLLVVVLILYYRNRQTIIAYVYIHFYNVFVCCMCSEEDLNEDKTYDAFVSYSSTDRDIAMALLNSLESNEEKFKLCIHERDWLPGYNISWNIVNSVQNSRRTILVVSKNFLESLWFQVEFHAAYYQMLEERVDRLIVIVRGELPPKDELDKELKFLLTTKTYLIWGERWFWEKLKYAMPHRKHAPPTNKLALQNRPNTAMVKTVEEQIANLTACPK